FGHPGVVVLRIAVAHEVPRAVDEGVHRVGLAPRGVAADRTHDARMEALVLRERVARSVGHAIGRQYDREVMFRHQHGTMLFAMDDRDRRTPVALAADAPVAQAPGGL